MEFAALFHLAELGFDRFDLLRSDLDTLFVQSQNLLEQLGAAISCGLRFLFFRFGTPASFFLRNVPKRIKKACEPFAFVEQFHFVSEQLVQPFLIVVLHEHQLPLRYRKQVFEDRLHRTDYRCEGFGFGVRGSGFGGNCWVHVMFR